MSMTNERGFLKITDDVYSFIAMKMTLETKGVAMMGNTIGDSFSNLIRKKNESEGISIERNDDGTISIDVYIHVQYGYRVPDIALRVQEKTKSAIEQYAETKVSAVNVFVQGLVFE